MRLSTTLAAVFLIGIPAVGQVALAASCTQGNVTTEATCGNCTLDSDTNVYTCTATSSDCSNGVKGCQNWNAQGEDVFCTTQSIDLDICGTCEVINQWGLLACDNILVSVEFTSSQTGPVTSSTPTELPFLTYSWSTNSCCAQKANEGCPQSGTQIRAPLGLNGQVSSSGFTFTITGNSPCGDSCQTQNLYDLGYRFSGVKWASWPGSPTSTNPLKSTPSDSDNSSTLVITDPSDSPSGSYNFYLQFKNLNVPGTIYTSKDPTIMNPGVLTGPGGT